MKLTSIRSIIISCLIVIATACSNQPEIRSASEEQVVVQASPQDFIWAYDLAQRKCQANVRNANYVPNYSDDLKLVAFNCLELETAEAIVETEEKPAEETEAIPEATSPGRVGN